MNKLQHAISSLSKNKRVPAVVVEIVRGHAVVSLSGSGRRLSGLQIIGGTVNAGDLVWVDYSSGTPVVMARGDQAEVTTQVTAQASRYRPVVSDNEINLGQNTSPIISKHAASHQVGGDDQIDVTGLSGVLANPQNANKLQGRNVSNDTPANGDGLIWDEVAQTWKPSPISSSSGGDMLKSIYDPDDDGKVLSAESADSAPWSGVTDKPETFPPEAHSHDYAASDHSHAWGEVSDKPATFPPSTHSHDYAPVSHSHAWSAITSKPTTFPPETHSHSYAPVSHTHTGDQITTAVANANAVPWSGVTGKPSTFTPSAHNQDWSTITGKPYGLEFHRLNGVYILNSATLSPGDYSYSLSSYIGGSDYATHVLIRLYGSTTASISNYLAVGHAIGVLGALLRPIGSGTVAADVNTIVATDATSAARIYVRVAGAQFNYINLIVYGYFK